jgi:ribosome maturation factor RimP
MSWQTALERTVTGLGYDLVDVERSASGLLRVTIDRLPGHAYTTGPGEFVLVEDCEVVTRQLQYLLEVENLDYRRLEVSSPGLDRPLRKPADWARFAGAEIDLTLRQPFQNRRKWRGVLASGPDAANWRLELTPDAPAKPVRSPSRARPKAAAADGPTLQVLDFSLDEVRDARLVPVVDFKGRRGAAPAESDAGTLAVADNVDGGQD